MISLSSLASPSRFPLMRGMICWSIVHCTASCFYEELAALTARLKEEDTYEGIFILLVVSDSRSHHTRLPNRSPIPFFVWQGEKAHLEVSYPKTLDCLLAQSGSPSKSTKTLLD